VSNLRLHDLEMSRPLGRGMSSKVRTRARAAARPVAAAVATCTNLRSGRGGAVKGGAGTCGDTGAGWAWPAGGVRRGVALSPRELGALPGLVARPGRRAPTAALPAGVPAAAARSLPHPLPARAPIPRPDRLADVLGAAQPEGGATPRPRWRILSFPCLLLPAPPPPLP
jgi:hypothetical protein